LSGIKAEALPFDEMCGSEREGTMTTLKVIEVLAESDRSWEEAAKTAVAAAAKTVRNIKSIYIKDFEAEVKDGKITHYRINAKITFALE
jgi:flavin-binding protein dodecin